MLCRDPKRECNRVRRRVKRDSVREEEMGSWVLGGYASTTHSRVEIWEGVGDIIWGIYTGISTSECGSLRFDSEVSYFYLTGTNLESSCGFLHCPLQLGDCIGGSLEEQSLDV